MAHIFGKIEILISSISCVKISSSLLISKYNTKKLFEQFQVIAKNLSLFGIEDLGLSLLSGLNLDTYLMSQLCEQGQLKIRCGDVPDENWTIKRVFYDLKMIRPELSNSKISFIEKLKLFVAQMIVWRFFGVSSKRMLKRKIMEMIEVTQDIDGKKYLRWDSRGLKENEDILDILPKNTVLLVEYYPESGHTPDQFWEYILNLNTKKEIQIKISFDPVHYWRAKKFFPDFKYTPEEMFNRIMENEKWIDLLGMMEISNVDEGSTQAHSSVLYGLINFTKIFSTLGKMNKKGLLKLPFFVVFEFNPAKIGVFMEEIEDFLKEIEENFMNQSYNI